MDTVSPARRSEIMRLVKNKDSKIEKSLQQALKNAGCRFRKNVATLPGKPDIVFSQEKLAVFVDSCFWHGCKQHCRIPSANRAYWVKKIEGNKKRDRLVTKELKALGWRAVRIWEHSIAKSLSGVVRKIEKALSNS